MSKEDSPELTKSWVFVEAEKQPDSNKTSGIQEITENEPHIDSDTDSISVISESGCSYKTDEEEFSPTEEPPEKEEPNNEETEVPEKEPKIAETAEKEIKQPEIVESVEPHVIQPFDENKAIEKLLYFATSAVCAIILVGFSVAVQHHFREASVNIFDPDQVIVPHVQNLKSESIKESPPKFNIKRKSQLKLDELENKIAKLQEGKEFHDKIVSPHGDIDLKSNNKRNKNKNPAAKANKENCDVSEKRGKTRDREKLRPHKTDAYNQAKNTDSDEKKQTDETCTKKVKELKVKEDYLREKEKFLIEKEHDLLKKEIKLNNEKQYYVKNKHDKKTCHKKEKGDTSEEVFTEYKRKYKPNKEAGSADKKYKHKEEKKQYSTQKRYRFSDEENKKRNISGQWYINLHEGRDNMRQKKRASFKKNKANWYFQWMVDRARLRVK